MHRLFTAIDHQYAKQWQPVSRVFPRLWRSRADVIFIFIQPVRPLVSPPPFVCARDTPNFATSAAKLVKSAEATPKMTPPAKIVRWRSNLAYICCSAQPCLASCRSLAYLLQVCAVAGWCGACHLTKILCKSHTIDSRASKKSKATCKYIKYII